MKSNRDKLQHSFNDQSNDNKAPVDGSGQPYRLHTITPLTPQDPALMQLLSDAFDEVYAPAFPIAEECESLETWMASLSRPNSNSKIVICIITGDKPLAQKPDIKGIVVGYYYSQEEVGLLAYTATAPQFRNAGLGRIQMDILGKAFIDIARQNGSELQGYFLECNDPAKVRSEDDSFDPTTRLKIFGHWGARIMPVDYVQPALSPDLEKCSMFKLLAYPHPTSGEYPTPGAILGFIHGIYKGCARYSGVQPEDDPDYNNMKAQLAALPQDKPVIAGTEAKKSPKPPANDR